MPYRNKTFVSFDGDNDMHYYRLMQAWHQNDGFDFNFYNAHDINTARDSSQEASIKAQLAERMRNSKLFVLLVGERTRYLTKFVQWEIEQAISRADEKGVGSHCLGVIDCTVTGAHALLPCAREKGPGASF